MTTTEMREYHKIPGPFRRETEGPNRNKIIPGAWTSPALEVLANVPWIFTEKVDGTNIRVHWDGHRVTFGGRTDNAQIPAKLFARLQELFTEELFEQTFVDTPAVTLYGEGYGAGIQKAGGNYSPTPDFVLFDVKIGGFWLLRDNVEDVAQKLGLRVVPVVLIGTLHDGIALVRSGLRSAWGNFPAEGAVGVTLPGLLDRAGHRIAVKIKGTDFLGGKR
jgi:RNA ligase